MTKGMKRYTYTYIRFVHVEARKLHTNFAFIWLKLLQRCVSTACQSSDKEPGTASGDGEG